MLRRIAFSRFGLAEDPRGQIVGWSVNGRSYLCDVVGVYRREYPAMFMLQTRHFNGEPGPDVAASHVQLVLPD